MPSYGTSAHDDAPEANSSTGGARTPLLAKPVPDTDASDGVELDASGKPQGSGSLTSSIGNLANTIIGSGMSPYIVAHIL